MNDVFAIYGAGECVIGIFTRLTELGRIGVARLFPIKHKNALGPALTYQALGHRQVLRSVESSICRVPVILPLNLYEISKPRSVQRGGPNMQCLYPPRVALALSE
jgi:hypothetical protein